MKKYLFVLCGLILFTSCDTDDSIASLPRDKYLELAYDDSYRYPDGFFNGNNVIGYVYYEIEHEEYLTRSIKN